MNHSAYVIAAAICVATQSICPATAALAPIGGDDFNDNSRLTANWGVTRLGGAGQLLEADRRLEYFTLDTPPPAQDFAAWDWNHYGGTNNQSWTFQIDVSMPQLTLSDSGQSLLFGLQVLGSGDNFFVYVHEEHSGGTTSRAFVAQLTSQSESAPVSSDVTALRLRFDGNTGNLFADYDPNGPAGGYQWTQLFEAPSFGFDSGTVSVFGQSNNLPIAPSDNVFGDNVMAVPEPSTHALLLVGLGMVGGAAFRRARRLPL